MAKVIIVDPPEGWKYGFPKVLPRERQDEIHQWLVEEGYPRKLLNDLIEAKVFHMRFWEQEENVDEQRL